MTPHTARPESLRAEEQELLARRSRVLLALAVVIYLGFHALDRLSAPEHAAAFLAVRVSVVVLYIGCAALLNTRVGRRMVVEVSLFFTTLTSLGVAVLAAWHAGWVSEYYLGILMAMFGASIFLPWTLGQAATFCGLSIGSYFALNLGLHGASVEMVVPSLFLFGTASVALVATELNARSRLEDHRLRGELQNAYGELKELDDLKTRFYANVSHELRTPLMLILGSLDELEARADERSRKLLGSVEKNALRLLRQVELLLDSAKAESGQLRCRPTPGNVGETLSQLVEAARPQTEKLGLKLETEGLDAMPGSSFDGEWVETIAANLISNAVKFTRPGGTVGVAGWATPTMVCFQVTDSGIGIPEEQLDAVFERFHQVDGSASREAEGTGLGLSMVKELVELHGGVVVVDSTVGSGSSFTVELPRAPEEVALHGPSPEVAGSAWREARAQARLADIDVEGIREVDTLADAPEDAPRIVVVEDNLELRTFLLERLSHRYRVEPAHDGFDGLEKIRKHPPDLVVSDVMMPRMDGLEMVRSLREDALLAELPVILLTARADVEDVVRGLDGGADDYVTKPFHVRELEARIDAVLRARAVERAGDERAGRLAAIGMMTSQIAHDLRNPLTSVVTFSALARETVADAGMQQAVEDLDAVISETRRATRMLKDVTEFASGGTREQRIERFELGALLHELAPPLASSVAPAGITLALEVLTLAEVEGDRDELRRAIENLVGNARDVLAPRGGGKVVVRLEWDEGAVVRVMDSGPGLPEELIDGIFEPFATHGKREGTGLGLAIVRNAVQRHRGTVEAVATGPLGGACFVLRLPATVPAEEHRPRHA